MDDPTLTTLFAVARAVHFGACLLLLCVPLFHRMVIAPIPSSWRDAIDRNWRPIAKLLVILAAAGALLSGIAWLGFAAIEMSGLPPREALTRDTLDLVWSQTQFGKLWQLRAIFWLAASVSTCYVAPERLPPIRSWIAALAGGCLVASLAWAGHGRTGVGVALHLTADIIHLVICALWPVGLLPFSMLLLSLRRSPERLAGESIIAITRRFSATSLVSVAILAISGVINSWSLVGPILNFWTSDYGRLLVLKIALFAIMSVIGARNLLHWKPLLLSHDVSNHKPSASQKLQRNVWLELLLAAIILLIVGYLGLMMPPFHEHPLHHHSAEETASETP